MNRFPRLLAASALALVAACSGQAPEPAPTTEAAAPEAKPGLSLAQGKLVLPAVAGNPAAAYFLLTNGTARPVTVAAVNVAGAGMAMMHETRDAGDHAEMAMLETAEVAPGATLAFARGGKHVMVMDPPAGLKPGATIELTITFADGDKLSAPLAVVAPGGE